MRTKRRTVFLMLGAVVLAVLAVWILHLENFASRKPGPGGYRVLTLALPKAAPTTLQGRPAQAATHTRSASLFEIPKLPPIPGAVVPPRPPPSLVHHLRVPPPGWYLQVAAYYSRASARRLVTTLKRNGFHTWFSAIVTHERRLVRLWVGPYRTRRSAYAIIGRLTALVGNPPFWIHVRARPVSP